MRAYVVRRLLLMVPMLFGISLVNFAIVNLAPAPRSSSVSEAGEFDRSSSVEANEGEFIFRRTFNLDKPTFLNARYALETGEILWLVATPLRPWEAPKARRAHQGLLDDYGRVIVPHLIAVGEAALDPRTEAARALRRDYEERWREARPSWLAAGQVAGQEPPPEGAPPFDDAARARLLQLALDRLANNAPRRPEVVYGKGMTEEIAAYNAEVQEERILLRSVYLDDRLEPGEKLARWRDWKEGRGEEWTYSFGHKLEMLFLHTRFAKFWKSLLTFDLGTSFLHRRPVWDLVLERLRISVTLSFGALLLAYALAVPIGIFSSVAHNTWADRIVSLKLFALYSFPMMFLGVLLREYLSVDADLFPVSGYESPDHASLTVLQQFGDHVWHLVLPLLTLTAASLALYSRYMKSGLIEILRADFVRTARAKGLGEFVVVLKHAVRNGLIPIITLLGASLPVLIGGSVVVEKIFGIDGMVKLGLEAVVKRDHAIIMGINVIAAVLTMVGVFLADLCYALVDPRISYR